MNVTPITQLLLGHYPGESAAAAFMSALAAAGERRLQYDFLTAAIRTRQALHEVRGREGGGGGGGVGVDGGWKFIREALEGGAVSWSAGIWWLLDSCWP